METGNMRYAADKPEKCTDCYFWHKRKGCCEREIGYYLVEQEKEQEPTEPVFAKLSTDAKLLYGLLFRPDAVFHVERVAG